jgi:hypothetical protein
MVVLNMLQHIPTEVVAAKVLPLLCGRDVVLLDSATLSHRSRQALCKAFAITLPVLLRLSGKDFELEYTAWKWFWRRSIPIILFPKARSFHQLSKMIGNENLTHGNVHLCYWGKEDSLSFARVFQIPALMQMVSGLSIIFKSAEDPILRNINAFPNLASVTVEDHSVLTEDMLVVMLRGVAPLKGLALRTTTARVTDAVVDALWRHAPTLESISLPPPFTTGPPQSLHVLYAQCSNLHTLCLENAFITAHTFSAIPESTMIAIATGCPKLRVVRVAATDPRADTLAIFASRCPELQSIDSFMYTVRLTDAGLAALVSNCANFTHLRSASWTVTNEAVVHAAHTLLARLQYVALQAPRKCEVDHTGSTMHTLLLAASFMQDLRTFSLSKSTAGTGLLGALARNCTQLRTVHIACNATAEGVTALATQNPLLEKLLLLSGGWLCDEVVIKIAASCPALKELKADSFPGPSPLTDAALVILAQRCPKLTELMGLSGAALTDAFVLALAKYCPDLAVLTLEHSPLVTESALTTLVQRCQKVMLFVCNSAIDENAIARLCTAAGERRVSRAMWTTPPGP